MAKKFLRVGGLAGGLRGCRGAAAASMVVTFLSDFCRDVEAGEVGLEDFAFGLLLVGGGRFGSGWFDCCWRVEGCDGIRRWLGCGMDWVTLKACPYIGSLSWGRWLPFPRRLMATSTDE